jgi:hypothetical protein
MTRRTRTLYLVIYFAAAGFSSREARGYDTLGIQWAIGNVPFRVNPNFPDTVKAGSPDEQLEIIRCAAEAWAAQTEARFRFEYEGTTPRAGFNDSDGVNVVAFVDADGGDALASTIISGFDGVAESFDVVFFGITDDIRTTWSGPGEPVRGELDIGGVAVHELGHGLGLGHTRIAGATMFAAATGRGLGLRTLHSDDLAGVEFLYGKDVRGPPRVEIGSLSPDLGPTLGGNEVVIEGHNFTYDSDTELMIGGSVIPGSSWAVESCSRMRILSMPPSPSGAVSLSVSNSDGSASREGAYRYADPPPHLTSVEPAEGPSSGGIQVTARGEHFTQGARLSIGGKSLLELEVADPNTITGILPGNDTEGPVDVVLTQGENESALAGGFSYNPYLLRVADAAGAPGEGSVPVELRVTSPADLSAISFAVVQDPAILSVRDLSAAGTAAEAAEFFSANIDRETGITTVEVVMDLDDPTPSFPRGDDVLLLRVFEDISPSAERDSRIGVRIEDGVGKPPIELIFTLAGGSERKRPLTEDGEIIVMAQAVFLRGDPNGDGRRDLTDAIFGLDFLFRGGPPGPCEDAHDVNDDGKADIADPIRLLQLLFQSGEGLPPPYPDAGPDPTPDELGCG